LPQTKNKKDREESPSEREQREREREREREEKGKKQKTLPSEGKERPKESDKTTRNIFRAPRSYLSDNRKVVRVGTTNQSNFRM